MLLLLAAFAAPPPDSAAAVKTLRVPAPWTVELVAAEPLLESPVALAFDERGRMFVAEYRDYPLGPPPGQPPLSRIRMLEDTDGDGRMDKATVFAEGLSFAQGLLPVMGGLLVTCAPDLLFLEDTDGDGKADRKTVWFTGFRPGNPQLRVAHPRRTLDNRIAVTNGLSGGKVRSVAADGALGPELDIAATDFIFDPATRTGEALAGKGQFGATYDDFGRRFVCTNRNPLRHAVLPLAAIKANPFAPAFDPEDDVAPSGGAAAIFPRIQQAPTAYGHTGTHTAACGVHIHRGDLLGDGATGHAFVCEPTAHLVTRNRLLPDGAGFRAERLRDEFDFLTADDPKFRPVSLADGPDGALYVVDIHRTVIEHPDYMPKGLAATLPLRAGADTGRIYRIQRKGAVARPWRNPTTAAERVALLADANGWRRDVGQRLLVEAGDRAALPALHALLEHADPRARVHAAGALLGLQALDDATLRKLFADPHEGVVEFALHAALRRGLAPDRAAAPALLDARSLRIACLATLAIPAEPDSPMRALPYKLAAREGGNRWVRRALLATSARDAATLALALALARAGDLTLVHDAALSAGACGDAKETARMMAALAAETAWPAGMLTLAVGLAEGLPRGPARKEIAALGGADFPAKMAKLAGDAQRTVPERAAAVKLLGRRGAAKELAALAPPALAGELAEAWVEAADRAAPAALLPRALAKLSSAPLAAAIERLGARPATVPLLLDALERRVVPAGAVASALRQRLTETGAPAARARAAKLFGSVDPDRQKVIDRYAKELPAQGDPARGHLVFKARCAACHRLGNEGGNVGPALADIGRKPAATLLTDILDPSRAVDPRYAAKLFQLSDGRRVSGIVAAETASAIDLWLADGKRESLPRDGIEAAQPSPQSLMPAGLEKDVSPAAFADLLAYLRDPK